jgi:hypothetical protein
MCTVLFPLAFYLPQSTMNDIMSDEDFMSMMNDEQERAPSKGAAAAAAAANGTAASGGGGAAAPPPHAGQHVDVGALLGGRPQPPEGGSPSSTAEGVRSRFANFFALEESPAGGGAAGGAAAAAAAASAGLKQQQLSFEEQLSQAAGGGRQGPSVMPPGMAPPPGMQQQQQQSANAGQALLAMLKQQQAAQRAAASNGVGGYRLPERRPLPPNAVNAEDMSALEEADKVARLTALQVCAHNSSGLPVPCQAAFAPAAAPGGTAWQYNCSCWQTDLQGAEYSVFPCSRCCPAVYPLCCPPPAAASTGAG